MKELKKYINNKEELKELRKRAVDFEDDLELGYENDMIIEFLDWVNNNSDDDIYDIISEIADNNVEIYTSEIFKLYSNNLGLIEYYNDATDEGLTEGAELMQGLMIGIYYYNRRILDSIADYLELH